ETQVHMDGVEISTGFGIPVNLFLVDMLYHSGETVIIGEAWVRLPDR
ncbi:unnamed protein product, partial [marine sediment metagenome]